MEDLFSTLEAQWDAHDSSSSTSSTRQRGEDGDFKQSGCDRKSLPSSMPRSDGLHPDVLVITGDHSTPSQRKDIPGPPFPFSSKVPCAAGRSLAFRERNGPGGYTAASGLEPDGADAGHGLRLAKFGA
jgi:2,3-bisphosphoglycerate-independent phosphoglycerate mutase